MNYNYQRLLPAPYCRERDARDIKANGNLSPL